MGRRAGLFTVVVGAVLTALSAWLAPVAHGLVQDGAAQLDTPDDAVAITAAPLGGYWVVRPDGSVFTFGGASYLGGANNVALLAPIVDLVATPSGQGYWLVAGDGGVFTFGDAVYYGGGASTAVVAAATPSGHGYWIVSAGGKISSFGDAAVFTSLPLTTAVIDVVVTATGSGLTLIGADGGTFTFGDASFLGSAAGHIGSSIVAAAPHGSAGLWLIDGNGVVYPIGDAPALGSGPTGARGVIAGPAGLVYLVSHDPRLRGLVPLPGNTGNGKRIVYSNSGQQVWLVDEQNVVIRSFRVSGKVAVPGPGWYRVPSKAVASMALNGSGITMRNMTRIVNHFGFHEIPRYANGQAMQTLDELGQFRSHGCVRLAPVDAQFVFNWAPVGTPVLILA